MFEFFFSSDRPFAAGLNAVIAALSTYAIFDANRALRRSHDDASLLNTLDISGLEGKEARRQALRDRVGVKTGTVAERIRTLSALHQQGVEIDHEILAAATAEKLRGALPVASWAHSVLVLFGLFGTLVGLAGALDGLAPLLEEGAAASRMVFAIGETISQMTVAFSTTLAGVIGALVVAAAVAIVRAQQSRLILQLESTMSTRWLPLFQHTEQTRLNDAVRELEETRKSLEAGLAETRSTLQEGLEGTTESVLRGFDKLESEFHERGGEILAELQAVRDATLNIIGERGAETPTLAEYVETVRATTEQLEAGVDKTADLLPRIKDSLQLAIRESQEGLKAALTEHTDRVIPVLERQESAAASLGKAVESEIARLGDVHAVLAQLGDSLERAESTWKQADDAIERLGVTTASALRDGLRETLAQVEQLTHQSASSQARLTSLVERFERTNEELFHAMSEQSRRSLNFSSEIVGEIRATLAETLSQVGRELAHIQSEQGSQLTEGLATLTRELRSLSAGPGSRPPMRSPRPPRLELGARSGGSSMPPAVEPLSGEASEPPEGDSHPPTSERR